MLVQCVQVNAETNAFFVLQINQSFDSNACCSSIHVTRVPRNSFLWHRELTICCDDLLVCVVTSRLFVAVAKGDSV